MQQPLEGHTHRRFDGELAHIHMRVLEMGTLVRNQVQQALEALKNKDLRLAHNVEDRDIQVNDLEVSADDEIVAVIARRAPVARDLRAVIALSKAVTDMERVGDEAARVAGMVLSIYDNDGPDPSSHLLRDVYRIGRLALGMLDESLEALDELDAARAQAIVDANGEMDDEFSSALRRLTTFIMEDHRNVGHAIDVVLITRSLARMGGHAKNIAEYVVYLMEGRDVRHHGENGAEAPESADRA